MVKFLILLFAYYILLLPCFPCTDTDECIINTKSAIPISSTDHPDDNPENEGCSPFCSCSCCGHIFVPNFQLEKVAVSKPIDNLTKQFFYATVSLSSDCFGSIWQPPKFS
ncbi:MAG: DUF6660 family protein [Chitinophagaceae bacterium]